jgi:hypothetical protein
MEKLFRNNEETASSSNICINIAFYCEKKSVDTLWKTFPELCSVVDESNDRSLLVVFNFLFRKFKISYWNYENKLEKINI